MSGAEKIDLSETGADLLREFFTGQSLRFLVKCRVRFRTGASPLGSDQPLKAEGELKNPLHQTEYVFWKADWEHGWTRISTDKLNLTSSFLYPFLSVDIRVHPCSYPAHWLTLRWNSAIDLGSVEHDGLPLPEGYMP